MAITPIPISALPKSAVKAGNKSDKDKSGTLNTMDEVRQAAIRTRLNNPGNVKDYAAFVSLAKEHGYDLTSFPIDDYTDIYKEMSGGTTTGQEKITDRTLPVIKTTVLFNPNDKDRYSEKLLIDVKPRNMATVRKGIIANDYGETREIIHLSYYDGKSRHPALYDVTGAGETDIDHLLNDGTRSSHAQFNATTARAMVSHLERAIKTLRSDPNGSAMIKSLTQVVSYLNGLLEGK